MNTLLSILVFLSCIYSSNVFSGYEPFEDKQASENIKPSVTVVNLFREENPSATTIVIEQRIPTDEKNLHTSVFPIFRFLNDHWSSYEEIILTESNKSFSYPSNSLGAAALEEWSKLHKIKVNKFYLLKQEDYNAWGFQTNVVKVYSSKVIKPDSYWRLNSKPIPKNIISIAENEFKQIHSKLNYQWKEADLRVFKSYKSKKGDWLVGMKVVSNDKDEDLSTDEDLETEKIYSSYEIAEPHFLTSSKYSDHWFFISRDETRYLGPNLEPITALNVTNHGKPNWLMRYSGYNKDGFVIYDDNFDKKVVFSYSYH